jgi:16S rRNA (guanine(966)-N(2))-methyltransferase RsmD
LAVVLKYYRWWNKRMRIIAGNFRGRKLVSPKNSPIRPTSDRVKEALFNMIGPKIPGSRVLDLFAGTGSLGLEAISRGAEYAVFVEKNAVSVKTLNENIWLLNIREDCEIIMADAVDALSRLDAKNITFDIVFVDPPYWENLYKKVLSALAGYDIIKNGGLVIFEHPSDIDIDKDKHSFVPIKKKRYGSTSISILAKEDDNENSSISGQF